METVRLEYSIDGEDLAALTLALAKSNPAAIRAEVRAVRKFIAWLAFLFLLIAAVISLTESKLLGLSVAIAVGGWIGTAILFYRSRKLILDRLAANARRVADTPAGRNSLGRRTVTCDPGGMTVETRFVTVRFQWAGVTDVFQADPFLFVQFPGPLNFGIPTSAFRDESDLGRFAERVRKWVVAAGGVTDPADAPAGKL